jgi:multidrug efflux pump subunit AcrB
LLAVALDHGKLVVLISLLIFGFSLSLIRSVKQEFVPRQDQNIILLTGQTPTGTSLQATYQKGLELEEVVKKHPLIERYFLSVGQGFGSSGSNSISMPLYLVPRENRRETHDQIMNDLRKQFAQVKGVRVTMRDNSARGLTSGRQDPVSFNIRGPNLQVLQDSADKIIDRLEKEGYTIETDTDFKTGLPELQVQPDRVKMAERGVAIDAVARTLTATVAGLRQSEITSDGRRHDIRVKLHDELVQSPADIENIEVRNSFGYRVPLKELVSFKNEESYLGITRLNRQRAIGIFGNLGPGRAQGEVLAAAEKISNEILPDGYSFHLEGASAGLSESFKSLGGALALGVLVAFMILAVQFNSFVHPISILAALPFSLTGALLILWLTGQSLNLFSFIGLIVLMGIAKKNSILLVEFTNQIREHQHQGVREALLHACPIRLRPIIMTSVATVVAALPLIFGNSMGQETRTPMGLTIAAGTIVSTLFTLLVVPCLYQLLSRFERPQEKFSLEEGNVR